MTTRALGKWWAGAAAAGLLALAVGAAAQSGGQLPMPKPYGDRGTRTLGDPPIEYPDPRQPPADPVNYWKSRIISRGHGGGTVIIINGSPCYAPWYYDVGFFGPGRYPYYYDASGLQAGIQLGNLQLGYQYQSGRAGYFPAPGMNYQQGYADQIGALRHQHQERIQRVGQQPRQEPGARRAAQDENDYYLHRKPGAASPLEKDPALKEAVRDIETAFRSGNISLLERHVRPTDVLTLQSKGRSRKPLAGAAYLEMTAAALKDMRTVSYTLDKVEPASGGAWMVYGRHVIRAEDGTEKAFVVGFVLKKRGEDWMIAEVSAEPAR